MIAEKKYLQPASIQEALLMADRSENDFRFLAGGTDVMVNRWQGNETSSCLIDLSGIDELKQVTKQDNYLSIGSLVKLDELKYHSSIVSEFPALIEAADAVGSPLIRKSATLGGNILCENRCIYYNQSEWWRQAVGFCLKCEGNICIATGSKKNCYSEFVSDTAPALICMDALLEVVDKEGQRRIKLEEIFTGDGVRPRNLDKTAVIRSVLLPLHQEFRSVFNKLRQRQSLDFTSLTTAVSVDRNGKLKIVLGGVDPKPVVVEGTNRSDRKELIRLALKKSRAIDNEMFSRNYRREMIGVFLTRSFQRLLD
ncbi:MAG: FAD binding domain-containing protein [Sphingobacteriales bacterium]|nr:FAD binding domain-containing protein [Sphingobacteriales bacterium]